MLTTEKPYNDSTSCVALSQSIVGRIRCPGFRSVVEFFVSSLTVDMLRDNFSASPQSAFQLINVDGCKVAVDTNKPFCLNILLPKLCFIFGVIKLPLKRLFAERERERESLQCEYTANASLQPYSCSVCRRRVALMLLTYGPAAPAIGLLAKTLIR